LRDSCLYFKKKNLVHLFKQSLKNEIELIKIAVKEYG